MYVFSKKKVTYLGGQVGDQAWKFSHHWVKAGHIGNPTGLKCTRILFHGHVPSSFSPLRATNSTTTTTTQNWHCKFQSVIKATFKHFLPKDFLKPFHKFKPLTCTMSTPVTFIGEYPIPPRMYIGPFKVAPSICFKGRLRAMLLILKNVFLFPCKQNFYKKGFALSLVLEWEK